MIKRGGGKKRSRGGGEEEVKMCLEGCKLVWSLHGLHTTSELDGSRS